MKIKIDYKKTILIKENEQSAILTTLESNNNNIYTIKGKILIDYIEILLNGKILVKIDFFLNLTKKQFSSENIRLITNYFSIANNYLIIQLPNIPYNFSLIDKSLISHTFSITEQKIENILENFHQMEAYSFCVAPPDGCSPGPPGHGDIFNLPIGYGDV